MACLQVRDLLDHLKIRFCPRADFEHSGCIDCAGGDCWLGGLPLLRVLRRLQVSVQRAAQGQSQIRQTPKIHVGGNRYMSS